VSATTSVLGSFSELREVLSLARAGAIDWTVDPLPLERVNDALDGLRRGDVEGRVVLFPPARAGGAVRNRFVRVLARPSHTRAPLRSTV
jgi:hypothetical protein